MVYRIDDPSESMNQKQLSATSAIPVEINIRSCHAHSICTEFNRVDPGAPMRMKSAAGRFKYCSMRDWERTRKAREQLELFTKEVPEYEQIKLIE